MRYMANKPEQDIAPAPADIVKQPLSRDWQENLKHIQVLLQNCSDAVIKPFAFGGPTPRNAFIAYFDGLVDRKEIENHLLKALMLESNLQPESALQGNGHDLFTAVKDHVLTLADTRVIDNFADLAHHVSSGDTVLVVDGYNQALAAGTRSWENRGIQSPENEVVIFGPKEGFSETLRFNTALMRRRLKSTNFKIESMVIGRISKTDVAISYIEGVASPMLVEEVRKRLQQIDIDAVLDSNYIKEFIVDHKYTIFSQVEHTEKPDRACAHMLEGRVCVMVDGSPMALVVPVSFPRYWISPEDYYMHFIPASLFRLLRFFTFIIALLLPSLYVAVISYHHEMVPTDLYLTIVATRQGVPFPAFVEAFILEFMFEMLREAGLRLPRAIGPAVSIVGALIIGDAAVRAGLVSTPMVVIIAATGIASFVSPSYNAGIIVRIARFGFLFASAMLGFLGIMIALIIMLIRMVSLSSFGLPYLEPLAPFNKQEMSDILIRRPWFLNIKRPFLPGMKNLTRQGKKENEENAP